MGHQGRVTLDRLLGALAADPFVEAVSLGGSHARGDADAYSDIDLCVRASEWDVTSLGGLWLAGQRQALAGMPFWHGVLADGTILDVLVGEPFEGYRVLSLPAPLAAPEGEAEPEGPATEFWINSYKHRKVLGRGLWPMAGFGIHHDRMFLLRLWVLLDRGDDPGPRTMSIHGMTPLIREHVDDARAKLLGLPCRTREETLDAIERTRDAVSEVSSALEERRGLVLPRRLEALVRGAGLP